MSVFVNAFDKIIKVQECQIIEFSIAEIGGNWITSICSNNLVRVIQVFMFNNFKTAKAREW